MKTPSPGKEAARRKALRQYQILDTPPESVFDGLTRLAAHLCQTPVALISLVAEDRVWFKSKIGLKETSIPREGSFCEVVVRQKKDLVIRDSLADPRFTGCPWVISKRPLRFYAGVPLLSPRGHALGVLCVLDRKPRKLGRKERDGLIVLSRQVMDEMEKRRKAAARLQVNRKLRRELAELRGAEAALRESEERYRTLVETSPDGITVTDLQGRVLMVNQQSLRLYGASRLEEMIGKNSFEFLAPEDHSRALENLKKTLETGRVGSLEYSFLRADGSSYQGELHASLLKDATGKPIGFIGVSRDITERKLAEAAVRESEERYRGLVETSPDAITLIDTQGKILMVNQQALQLYRLPGLEDALGRNSFDFIAPEDRSEAMKSRATTLEAGRQRGVEHRLRRADGTVFLGEIHSSVLRDSAGQAMGIMTVTRDITERKRAEEALRESEEKYRLLVNNIPSVTWQSDRQGRTTFISANVEKIYGFTPAEIYAGGESLWFGRIHPEDEDRVRRVYESLFETGAEFNIEYRIQRKDGEWIWLQDRALVHAETGNEENTYGIFSDITERKRAEESLRESEARYRSLFDDSPVSFWEEDFSQVKAWVDRLREKGVEDFPGYFEEHPEEVARGAVRVRVKEVNRATLEFYQAKSKSELLRGLAKTFTQENLESFKKQLLAVAEGRTHFKTDMVNQTLSGEKRQVIMHWSVAPGYEQSFGKVLVSIIDLTERKRLEAQVLHAQKLESLGILAGGIAHDFNNLLVSILGHAELSQRRIPRESPAQSNLRQIEVAARRAAELTKQMLAYSGRGTFVVQPINLSRLVDEMAHLLEVGISKQVRLIYLFAEDLPAIEADATQVRQVIMNLITNASEAIGDQSGTVQVNTGVMEADRAYLSQTCLDDDLPAGRYVFLEVSDTGSGMDKETTARIFDPFFSTKFTGRGLGLASVLGIVRGHLGAIKVYSEPGQGTSFKVLFPCSARPLQEATADQVPLENWRGSGIILVVDDEEIVRTVTRAMLEEFGFQALEAEDGHQGVELLEKHGDEIKAVILDMTMPGLSGEETLREMLRLKPEARIILTSGYNEQEATRRFAGKGLASFLQKPYPALALIEKLQEVLKG